ncbi:hypothetical protein [Paracoccus sp. (in: a-proteobacteria)]|uniref:hypothetical protein n=1 Tax=Paracoccus sp. TaxID=267 RepID=UPI00272D9145|nr:hypothetical protein [Paracoccus sp. (in: a-proteobacteria)]
MTDPRSRVSARSDDLGETLYNIRRMIAEDDALAAARDRLQLLRDQVEHEDSAEFLARRHGGNAALARQLAGAEIVSDLMGGATTTTNPLPSDQWPLGTLANAPDAPRPTLARAEPARNDLPRRLGSLFDELTEDLTEPGPDGGSILADFETVLAATPEPLAFAEDAPAGVADDPAGDDEEAQIRDLLSRMVRDQIAADLAPALDAHLDQARIAGIGSAMQGDLRLETREALERMERALAEMQTSLDSRLQAALSDDLPARIEADLARLSRALREEFGEGFVTAADLVRATGALGAELADRSAALRDDLVLAKQDLRAEMSAQRDSLRQDLLAGSAQLEARFDAAAEGLRADLTRDAALLRADMLSSLPAIAQAEIDASLPDRIASELKQGLRDVVLGDLRETVQTEIESDLPERIRQELGHTLPQIRAEMDEAVRTTCDTAVTERLGALIEGSLRDQVREGVRHELEGDLAGLLRQQLQGSLREAIEGGIRAELSDMIRGELLGELGERFSRNLRIVIRREVAAALDAQMHRI